MACHQQRMRLFFLTRMDVRIVLVLNVLNWFGKYPKLDKTKSKSNEILDWNHFRCGRMTANYCSQEKIIFTALLLLLCLPFNPKSRMSHRVSNVNFNNLNTLFIPDVFLRSRRETHELQSGKKRKEGLLDQTMDAILHCVRSTVYGKACLMPPL